MALGKLWTIAWRDLGRNRRRSLLTLLAVGLGLALLMMLNGLVAGVVEDTVQNAVRFQTGHLQLRAEAYEPEMASLLPADLLDRPDEQAARAAALDEVIEAAPVLWAVGFLNTAEESVGVQINGIDPGSAVYDPMRESMVEGRFLAADDREGVVVGQSMAGTLGLQVGRKVSLTVVNADGRSEEGTFELVGLMKTGIGIYDSGSVWMPLAKAQAFTGARGRASAIVVHLEDQEDADRVGASLAAPGLDVVTWREMNGVLVDTMRTANSYYRILDAIVMLVVATIIANTLLMAVFERIREIGILSALGMKRGQVLQLFLLEGLMLALGGVAVGLVLGSLGVAWLATRGIYFGDVSGMTGALAMGSTMYGRFVPGTFAWLAVATVAVILLASLYPAWFASRLQPVDALHRS